MGSLRSKFIVVAGDALIVSWRRASGDLHQLRKNFLLGCVYACLESFFTEIAVGVCSGRGVARMGSLA